MTTIGAATSAPVNRDPLPGTQAWTNMAARLHNQWAEASARAAATGMRAWSDVPPMVEFDADGNAIVSTSPPTYTKQTFGSKQDALNWANTYVDEVAQHVDMYNGLRKTLNDPNWGPLTPEQVKESRALLESQSARVLGTLTNFSNILKASFQVSGPLWTVGEDGQLSLNAFKVRHGDHGTLVRVDAAGAVHTPGGTPQDPWRLMNGMPPEGRIVNAMV